MNVSKVTRLARKVLKTGYCGAVIVAAGTASRMGGIDKVMAPLCGEPMIVHTVRAFQACDAIREIVVVTRQDLVVPIMDLCHGFDKVHSVITGGDSRQASVAMGIAALSSKTRLVAVHDGARPLVSAQLIDRTVRAADAFGAAAPAIPVKDTVKEVKGGLVSRTPERDTLKAAQTPQVFDIDLLKVALAKAQKEGAAVTDDCSAVERMGISVRIVEGDEGNIKVTTPMDLMVAQLLMEAEK